MSGERYAIYYDPAPDSALDRFGRFWFAADGPPDLPGFDSARLAEVQTSARHYGFHATMKAPFTLALGLSEQDLHQALRDFAETQPPLTLPALKPTALGPYLTLRPDGPALALEALAADCVQAFEPMRAPLEEADIARRRKARLTPRQDALMLRWGYPYVMEEFRFHMTLAGPLRPEEMDRLLEALQGPSAELCGTPFVLDRLSLHHQPRRDAAFSIVCSETFGGDAGAQSEIRHSTAIR